MSSTRAYTTPVQRERTIGAIEFLLAKAVRNRTWVAPIVISVVLLLTGTALYLSDRELWIVPGPFGTVLAGAVAALGVKRGKSRPAQWLVSFLVPDGGQLGVVDRPSERFFVVIVLAYAGWFLSAMIAWGWSRPLLIVWVAATVALTGTYGWHRRRRGNRGKWVRRWCKHVPGNPYLHGVVDEVTTIGSEKNKDTGRVRLVVEGPLGWTVALLAPYLNPLCSAMKVKPGSIAIAPHLTVSNRGYIDITTSNPFDGTLWLPPVPEGLDMRVDPMRAIGLLYRDAERVLIDMWQHWKFLGATRKGKSTAIDVQIATIGPDIGAAQVGADVGGRTLPRWTAMFSVPLATTDAAGKALAEGLVRGIDYRDSLRYADPAAFKALPWLFFMVGERGIWVRRDPKVVPILTEIDSRGLGVKIACRTEVQNNTQYDWGTTEGRDQYMGTVAFGMTPAKSRQTWGKDGGEHGWNTANLPPGDGMVQDSRDNTDAALMRGLMVNPEDDDRIIASNRDVLDEGTRQAILGEQAPSEVPAELTSTPAELVRPSTNGSVNHLHLVKTEPEDDGLTERDRQVLGLLDEVHAVIELQKQLGLNRNKVNSTLKKLREKKLVENRPGQGWWLS